MSNSPEVPNLVCDPYENQRKLALTSTREKLPETSSEAISPFKHVWRIIFYFIRAASHMKSYAAWTSLTMYDTLKWKQITHVQKCIFTFGSLLIADNILKAAIVTVSSLKERL